VTIKLGNRVRDSLTGFEGIAVSRHQYQYGCTRIGVEAEDLDEKGCTKDASHFDEQRLEVVKKSRSKVSKDSEAKTGGPGEVPPSRPIPSR